MIELLATVRTRLIRTLTCIYITLLTRDLRYSARNFEKQIDLKMSTEHGNKQRLMDELNCTNGTESQVLVKFPRNSMKQSFCAGSLRIRNVVTMSVTQYDNRRVSWRYCPRSWNN